MTGKEIKLNSQSVTKILQAGLFGIGFPSLVRPMFFKYLFIQYFSAPVKYCISLSWIKIIKCNLKRSNLFSISKWTCNSLLVHYLLVFIIWSVILCLANQSCIVVKHQKTSFFHRLAVIPLHNIQNILLPFEDSRKN